MADERDAVLNDNDRGCVSIEGNELLADSKIEDAAAVRVGAVRGPSSGGGGKFAFDVLAKPEPDADPEDKVKRREICSMTCGEGADGSEWGLTILKKEGNTVDADQIKTIRATAAGIEFLVPVKFAGSGGDGPENELRAPGGLYWLVIQSDGNFVAYKNRVAYDYSTGVAYWNSGTVNPAV